MKAAVFYPGRDVRLEELPAPSPAAGEVLVEVRAAGICGSDLHRYRGENPWAPPAGEGSPPPFRLGHELAGVVAELGPEARGVAVGQRVAVEPSQLAGCGVCAPCRRGARQLCRRRGAGGRRSAAFSELDVALAGHALALPDHLPFAEASMADVYACGVHALHRAPVAASSTVAIVGTGPVALALGQLARAAGARRTIVVGRRRPPLEVALRAGAADAVVDSGDADPGDALRELNRGTGADVTFEAVGGRCRGSADDTLRQALRMARAGGVVVVLGAFSGDLAVPYREANEKEIDLRWSNGYSTWRGDREYRLALDLIAAGRVSPAPLITHRFPLDRVADAFAAAQDKAASGAIKVVVEPS